MERLVYNNPWIISADMAELADAYGSGPYEAIRGSSSLPIRTMLKVFIGIEDGHSSSMPEHFK